MNRRQVVFKVHVSRVTSKAISKEEELWGRFVREHASTLVRVALVELEEGADGQRTLVVWPSRGLHRCVVSRFLWWRYDTRRGYLGHARPSMASMATEERTLQMAALRHCDFDPDAVSRVLLRQFRLCVCVCVVLCCDSFRLVCLASR